MAKTRGAFVIAAAILVLVIMAVIVQVSRPLPVPLIHAADNGRTLILDGHSPRIPWPAHTSATVQIEGIGSFGVHGPTAPIPIGSVAKIMTAYLILKSHPLGLYSDGPSLTMTAAEALTFRADALQNQSVMPVIAGEHLSERTLLEGLLVASGNNVAQILARWDAGSIPRFVAMMNAQARKMGMAHTIYAGPSGLNPQTVSTVTDQVRLANAAMSIPAFRQIVAMPAMEVPGVKTPEENYDYDVGHDGIIGIKTGSTTQGGASFIFAAHEHADGRLLRVEGAVAGQFGTAQQPSQLQLALSNGQRLIDAAARAVQSYTIAAPGQKIAVAQVAGSKGVALVAKKSAVLLGWEGLPYHVQIRSTLKWPHSLPVSAGTIAAEEIITQNHKVWRVPLALSHALPAPSWLWRATRL